MSARKPARREAARAVARTFAIQGSWNYRTLVGAGLAYAMLPLLKRIHAGDPVALRESLERHASSFNGHPYLCAMAVGALARLELEDRDAAQLRRFRTALSGPLGALGDRAIWSGWRPFCALLAGLAWAAGLPALPAVLLFLALYNVGHVGLRVWAYREGWRAGLDVGGVLARSPLNRAAELLIGANVLLLGLVAALLAVRVPGAAAVTAVLAAAGTAVIAYLLPRAGGALTALLLVGAGGALWLA